MFADSLLETSWTHRSRRGWTTLTSFGVQAGLLASFVLLSLFTTVGLPKARIVSTPLSIGRGNPDPGPAPHTQAGRSQDPHVVEYDGRLRMPARFPIGLPKGGDNGEPAIGGSGTGDSILPIGSQDGLPMPLPGTRPVMPAVPVPAKPQFRSSNLLEGSLIRRVQPVYPPLARAARIQGPVVLAAIISREGTMEHVQLISGYPMLVPAAIQAVSQWRYKPYILNGEAIEVETQITVNFILGQD